MQDLFQINTACPYLSPTRARVQFFAPQNNA